jgi:hypothetical protein
MTITCEYSHRHWKHIVSLLDGAKRFKKGSRKNLKGNQKKRSNGFIYRVCHTGADVNSINSAIIVITKNCHKNRGKNKVKVILSENIFSLINQLSRFNPSNHPIKSTPPS